VISTVLSDQAAAVRTKQVANWPAEIAHAVATRTRVQACADLDDMNLMPSMRKGTAHFFTETLHPSGGAVIPKILMVASGTLDNGTDFKLRFMRNSGTISTRITFSD
jgi:hypothetical protein